VSVGAGRRAVAIGGGTGLPQVLRCLVDLGFETSAVVTMADDGGSSGVLRRQLGILPPGDVRNCLVALAAEEEGTLARVFQYRFEGGEGLAGHALGNLIIAALADISGDFRQAVMLAEHYLGVRGRVLPSTFADVVLHGVDRTGAEISGQTCLATNPTAVANVFLEPAEPPANPEALEAIAAADVVVIGPGSLYTSLIPNFLVAGVAETLRSSRARRVYVCNVANLRGETGGLDAAEHVEALLDHGLSGAIDAVLVHRNGVVSEMVCDDGRVVEPVCADDAALARIESLGSAVFSANLIDPHDCVRHSRSALRAALEEVLS